MTMVTSDASEAWVQEIYDAVVAHVMQSGYFQRVNSAEATRSPTSAGLYADIWINTIESVGAMSGLSVSAARLMFTIRTYMTLNVRNPDLIDPKMVRAVSGLMRQYHDDFDFGGIIRNVDLFGTYGVGLIAFSGYMTNMENTEKYRTFDIMVPCLVNDVWPQNVG